MTVSNKREFLPRGRTVLGPQQLVAPCVPSQQVLPIMESMIPSQEDAEASSTQAMSPSSRWMKRCDAMEMPQRIMHVVRSRRGDLPYIHKATARRRCGNRPPSAINLFSRVQSPKPLHSFQLLVSLSIISVHHAQCFHHQDLLGRAIGFGSRRSCIGR
jgi:hypothetical protein